MTDLGRKLAALDDTQRKMLYLLALAYDGGGVTVDEFNAFGRMLGLLPDPDVDNRPKRGHVKGDRGRAVPGDWSRRGAVGA